MITSTLLAFALTVAAADERPLIGDVVNGDRLLKKAGADVKIDGAWLNIVSDEVILTKLQKGQDDFPQIDSENLLDRWDVLASLRAKNADLRDLASEANTVLVMNTKYDENASKRLSEQAKLKDPDGERRVFGLFKLEQDKGAPPLTFVAEKDNKKRDKLKKTTKVGYAVFVKMPNFRGGKYEAAFAIDKDMRISKVEIHGPDGAPTDLNQAAARFAGKGARGQYAALKAGGAGKAIGELEKPLSDAYLMAAESVYMFEVIERDYFAFDD